MINACSIYNYICLFVNEKFNKKLNELKKSAKLKWSFIIFPSFVIIYYYKFCYFFYPIFIKFYSNNFVNSFN